MNQGHTHHQILFACEDEVADLQVSRFEALAGKPRACADGGEIAALAYCFTGGENVPVSVFGGAAVLFARVRVMAMCTWHEIATRVSKLVPVS